MSCRASPSKQQLASADKPLANVIVSELAHTSDSSVDTEKAYEFTLRGERYELDRTGRFTCGNAGQAALEGSTLYVSAIGFVGRFDVEAWRYDWTHGNLYERYKQNAFGKPVVFRDRVAFPETTYSSGSVPRKVVIQKSSGAIAISAQRPQAAGS